MTKDQLGANGGRTILEGKGLLLALDTHQGPHVADAGLGDDRAPPADNFAQIHTG